MSQKRNLKILLFFVKILLLILLVVPGPVCAQGPIDLMIDSTGSFPWHETGIKPGSHGSTSVDFINNGTIDGVLFIWVANISQTDAFGDGAALGTYMYFDIAHPKLVSTLPLPSRIDAFPSAPLSANYIIISRVRPGERISLNWTWEFTETGQVQNDAQGDTLKFDIFYMLVNGGPPVIPTIPGGGGSGYVRTRSASNQSTAMVSPTEEITPVMNITPESMPSTGTSDPPVTDYRSIMIIGFLAFLIAVIIISQRKK